MTGFLMSRLLGFRDRTKSADGLNVDAKEHSLHRRNQRSVACFRQRDSPPFRTLRRQSFPRVFPLRGVVLGHIQFQVGSSHNYASPVPSISDFVGLQANLWILPHPLNLLAEGGKDVEAIGLVRKCNWHHIRLIVKRTSQPADRYPLQERAAFLFGHGNDSHESYSPYAAASVRSSASRGGMQYVWRWAWCPGSESNRYDSFESRDIKSRASASFATPAFGAVVEVNI